MSLTLDASHNEILFISKGICRLVSLKTFAQVASSNWNPLSTLCTANACFPLGLRLDAFVLESISQTKILAGFAFQMLPPDLYFTIKDFAIFACFSSTYLDTSFFPNFILIQFLKHYFPFTAITKYWLYFHVV